LALSSPMGTEDMQIIAKATAYSPITLSKNIHKTTLCALMMSPYPAQRKSVRTAKILL